MSYAATVPADARLQIRRGAATARTIAGSANAGANTIAWTGRLAVRGRQRPAPEGAYTLQLTLTAPDGQVATAQTKVRVKRLRTARAT